MRSCKLLSPISWRALAFLAGLVVCNSAAFADSLPKRVHSMDDGYFGRLAIPLNKSETVRLDRPFAQVRVASPEIAQVVPLSDSSIYVLARDFGTTDVSILDSQSRLIGVMDIEVTLDFHLVEAKIHESTGNRDIVVRPSDGQLIVSGVASDATTVERAIQIASQFSPGGVINAMKVASPQQVLLKVRFVEASRNAGRELGFRWDARTGSSNVRIGTEQHTSLPPGADRTLPVLATLTSGGTPFGVVLASLLNDGHNIDLLIQAIEQRGLGRRLAEPNLVAMSGDTADFQAGGQFPVPVPAADGNVAIDYKDFGVLLAFTPTVLKNGHISLQIEPEVSELDFATGVTVAGVTVPALTRRRASTTVELRDGQSFAIAGLLQTEQRRQISQLPWISRIPILGALFRSTNFASRETDLVIIVTPHLVEPGAPGQHIATPLDRTLPANDVDLFLHGELELPKDYRHYVESGGQVQGPYGHILGMEHGYQGMSTKR